MREIEKRINNMIKRSEVILNAGKQTNEEYLKSCNTEQLAEFLYNIRYDYQVPWKNKGVVEWLKQPHKE